MLFRFLTLFLAAGICFGQRTELSLRDALQQALAHNPLIDVSRSRIEQARGVRTQAGLSPNPRLYLQTEDVRWTGNPPFSYWQSTEDYVYFGQLIETGGKRRRRVDLAGSNVQNTELQDALLKRQIEAGVSASYWAAAGAARMRELYQRNLNTYNEDVNYIQNRVREGVAAAVDLMRIQTERDRIQVQVINSGRDYEQALVELYRAMGGSQFGMTTRLSDSLDGLPAFSVPGVEEALRMRVEEKLAREGISRAEANARLQRANGKPDPEAFVGYKRNVGFDTLYVALQIDLPLRNRNQGNIGAAEAELQAAKSSLRVTEANIKADVVTAARVYENERKVLDQMPDTRARAEETARLARAAYREGGIDLVRLLDAERSLIDFDIQYSQTLVLLKQSVVNLRLAGGMEILP